MSLNFHLLRRNRGSEGRKHGFVYGDAIRDVIHLHLHSVAASHNDLLLRFKRSSPISRRSYGRDFKFEQRIRFRDSRGWDGGIRFGAPVDGSDGLGRAVGRKGRGPSTRNRGTRPRFQQLWLVPGLSLRGNVLLHVYQYVLIFNTFTKNRLKFLKLIFFLHLVVTRIVTSFDDKIFDRTLLLNKNYNNINLSDRSDCNSNSNRIEHYSYY